MERQGRFGLRRFYRERLGGLPWWLAAAVGVATAAVGVGITSLASLIYLAKPYVAIGGWHPLQSYIGREICIVLLVAAAASFGSFQF